MPNMREIKTRIKIIKDTMQITKAMKLISAVKLKKARKQLELTLPFFDKVKHIMSDILVHSGSIDNIYFDLRSKKEAKKKGYLVLTGDRGLAGGYNHNIISLTENSLKGNEDSLLLVAGHMGRTYFMRRNRNVMKNFDYPVQNPTTYRAREIADIVLELFQKSEIDEFYVIYTKMISSLHLEPHIMQLLPLKINKVREDLNINENQPIIIDESLVYEPSSKYVFDVLIPKYVKGILYGVFVEAFTSEQSARMTAMDNATSNAEDILCALKLNFNRARQSAITKELSEIMGGAAVLK